MVLGDFDAIKCTFMVAIDASMQCRSRSGRGFSLGQGANRPSGGGGVGESQAATTLINDRYEVAVNTQRALARTPQIYATKELMQVDGEERSS